MNILFLTAWYPTKDAPLRGIFVKEHAAAIQAAGHKVVVIALNVVAHASLYTRDTEVFTDESGVEVHIIHIQSRLWKWIYVNPLWLYFYVLKYYKKNIHPVLSPDIVHSNVLSPSGLIGYWISKQLRVPHVITEHWSKADKFLSRNLFAPIGKYAYRDAAAITTVSGFLKDRLTKHLNDSQRVAVVPNVVESNIFSFAAKVKKGETVFTAVATWKAPKQPHLFIHALDAVQKRLNNSKLVLNMVGEGPLLDEIKSNAASYSFTINFTGNLSKEKIAALLHESDFFLHASVIETFSLVVAEALSTGTPVIASNVGALPELITPASGLLCNNSAQAWIDAIYSALDKEYDHASISAAYNERFSTSTIGKLFNDVYRKATRHKAEDRL